MNRLTLSIAILFILIMILNAPFLKKEEETQTDDNTPEAWDPNYRAKNMESTLYNKKGEINHKVFANAMEHYEMLGFTLFENPEYTIYTDRTDQPWKINAEEGTLYSDNRIQLEQNVRIRSLNQADFVQTIETSFIEIDLDNNTMTSDQPVTITGPEYVITSNGFTANLLTRKFELINHVQTVYQRQPTL